MTSVLSVHIRREAKVPTFPFTEYFQGFEEVEAVQQLFGPQTKEVLQQLRIEFRSGRGYMGVSGEDGHIRINAQYLNTGRFIDLYLDIIHELVHVRQFLDGRELRDPQYTYADRPTEIEAFQYTVEEALRLGLTKPQILEYLQTEQMSDELFNRLTSNLRFDKDQSITLTK
jgi:hypothetical protein